MRIFLLTLFTALLAGPSLAQATIDDLHISRDGEVVNIRASLRNPGPDSQPGPLQVELFARQLGQTDWLPVHTWSDLRGLAVGHRVSRDFFSTDGDTVSGLALGEFEVRAVLTGPNVSQTVEKTAEHEHDH